MTTTTLASPQAKRTSGWQPVARQVLTAWLKPTGWFWGGVVVVGSVALFTVSRFTDISLSGMQFVQQAGLWFQFAMAIVVVTVYLPVHVAAGTTRRSFFRGVLFAAGATAIGTALVLVALLLVEGQIYSALGWFHGGDDVPSQTVLAGGVWRYFSGTMLIYVAGVLSGLLVGAAYYRLGGLKGTVALPLTLAPLLLVSMLARTSVNQWSPLGSSAGVSDWWSTLASLVLLVLATVALHLIVRRVPIR